MLLEFHLRTAVYISSAAFPFVMIILQTAAFLYHHKKIKDQNDAIRARQIEIFKQNCASNSPFRTACAGPTNPKMPALDILQSKSSKTNTLEIFASPTHPTAHSRDSSTITPRLSKRVSESIGRRLSAMGTKLQSFSPKMPETLNNQKLFGKTYYILVGSYFCFVVAGVIYVIAHLGLLSVCGILCDLFIISTAFLYLTGKLLIHIFFLLRAYLAQGIASPIPNWVFTKLFPAQLVLFCLGYTFFLPYYFRGDCYTAATMTPAHATHCEWRGHNSPDWIPTLATGVEFLNSVVYIVLFALPLKRSIQMSNRHIRQKSMPKQTVRDSFVLTMKINIVLTCVSTVSTLLFMLLVGWHEKYWWLYTSDFATCSLCCFCMLGVNRRFLNQVLGCGYCTCWDYQSSAHPSAATAAANSVKRQSSNRTLTARSSASSTPVATNNLKHRNIPNSTFVPRKLTFADKPSQVFVRSGYVKKGDRRMQQPSQKTSVFTNRDSNSSASAKQNKKNSPHLSIKRLGAHLSVNSTSLTMESISIDPSSPQSEDDNQRSHSQPPKFQSNTVNNNNKKQHSTILGALSLPDNDMHIITEDPETPVTVSVSNSDDKQGNSGSNTPAADTRAKDANVVKSDASIRSSIITQMTLSSTNDRKSGRSELPSFIRTESMVSATATVTATMAGNNDSSLHLGLGDNAIDESELEADEVLEAAFGSTLSLDRLESRQPRLSLSIPAHLAMPSISPHVTPRGSEVMRFAHFPSTEEMEMDIEMQNNSVR